MNIFTQMNEPQKKDGIWIKTNHTYQNVMVNQQFANYQDGVWSTICQLNNMGRIKLVINQGALYLFSNKDYKLYRLNGSALEYICDYNSRTNVMASYNNSLYIITASASTGYVFKYNGNNWERVSEFYSTMYFDMDCVTLYNDQICLFYGNNNQTIGNHIYLFNGSTFTQLCSATFYGSDNYEIIIKSIITYNGKLYMFGGVSRSPADGLFYFVLNAGNNWTRSTVPLTANSLCICTCVYNNELYLFYEDRDTTNDDLYYCKYNGASWTLIGKLNDKYQKDAVSLNQYMYTNGSSLYKYTLPNKVYNPNTVIINKGDAQNGVHLTSIFDTSYMVGNNSNRFVSGFDDCFYFADTAFDWNAPMYYGDGSKWIKFKN